MVISKNPKRKEMKNQLGLQGNLLSFYQLRVSVKTQLQELLESPNNILRVEKVIEVCEGNKYKPLQKVYLLGELLKSSQLSLPILNRLLYLKMNLIVDNINLFKVDILIDVVKPLLLNITENNEFDNVSLVLSKILGLLKSSGINSKDKDIIGYEIENLYLDNMQLFNNCTNIELKDEILNLILTIAKYCSYDCLLNQCLDEGNNSRISLGKSGIINGIVAGALFLTLSLNNASYASQSQGENIKSQIANYNSTYDPNQSQEFFDRELMKENVKFIMDNGKKLLSDQDFVEEVYFGKDFTNSSNYDELKELKEKFCLSFQNEINVMYEAIFANIKILQDYKSKVSWESQKKMVTKTTIFAIDKLINQLNKLLDKLIELEKKLNNEVEL
ncbi:MAG: hypothetical protein V3575_02215 [Candidatus Absconditabacteria bacterium]